MTIVICIYCMEAFMSKRDWEQRHNVLSKDRTWKKFKRQAQDGLHSFASIDALFSKEERGHFTWDMLIRKCEKVRGKDIVQT